jgi:hypothetical protein
MARVRITVDGVGETAAKALDDAVAGVGSTLELAAQRLAVRATRLQGAAERLKQQQGADLEEVAQLEQATAQAAVLQREVRTQATRQARRPKLAPEEWLLFGQVLQPDGQPASGVLVRVAGDGDTSPDFPKDQPDEFGDFSVAYRRDHFPDPPDPPADVHVVVETEDGQRFYQSDSPMRFTAGQAEYLAITLSGKPIKAIKKPAARSKARRAPTSSKPASPRRPRRRQS